jgi:hypothetical protein
LNISISKQNNALLILIPAIHSGSERVPGHLNLGTLKVKNQEEKQAKKCYPSNNSFSSRQQRREKNVSHDFVFVDD